MEEEKLTLFNWAESITHHKRDLMTIHNESQYEPFLVNRYIGMNQNFIHMASFLNALEISDRHMHYQFLMNAVEKPPRKQFIKFIKAQKASDEVEMISRYYNVNQEVAAGYLKLLTQSDLDQIESRLNPDMGGKGKLEKKKK